MEGRKKGECAEYDRDCTGSESEDVDIVSVDDEDNSRLDLGSSVLDKVSTASNSVSSNVNVSVVAWTHSRR